MCSNCHKEATRKLGGGVGTAPTCTFPLTKLAMSSVLSKTGRVCSRFRSSQSQCCSTSSSVAPGAAGKTRVERQEQVPEQGFVSQMSRIYVYGIFPSWVLTAWTSCPGCAPLEPGLPARGLRHLSQGHTSRVTLGHALWTSCLFHMWHSYGLHTNDKNIRDYSAIPGL